MLGGIMFIILAFLSFENHVSIIIFFSILALIIAVPILYSYSVYKKSTKNEVLWKTWLYANLTFGPLSILPEYQNALNGIEGIFDEWKIYEVNKNELDEFEKEFVKKEKGYSKTQDRFNELLDKYI